MLLSEIRDEVAITINDSTFTSEIIDSYINEVYFSVVARCLVPDLKGMDVVTTSILHPYVILSGVTGGFSGILSRVYNRDKYSIKICNTLETLMDIAGNLTDTGDIIACALEGSTLWYYRLPIVAEVLTVIYYKNPDTLASDSDSPDYIPQFLHRKILVHGVCSICWDKIERGLEGLKVNTRANEIQKEEGVIKFQEWLGKTRKHYVKSQEIE